MGSPRVCVVIVNWNGWADTLECLESLLRSAHPSWRVIVCDNDSQDGSVEQLREWAEGRLAAPVAARDPLRSLSWPPVPKPVRYRLLERAEAEAGGPPGEAPALEIVRTGGNLGFAGGNNVALRRLLARGDFDYVWLLNNDTVVPPSALGELVRRMEERPDAGLCGSTLLLYDAPARVQARGGGSYDPWLGIARLVDDARLEPEAVERRLAYPMAASLLVSRAFVEQVGLMNEEYFLFCEELDWATRARGRFAIAYAPASVVYHKGGSSTGSSDPYNRVVDFYMSRSQLLYAWRHTRWSLPFVGLRHALVLVNSLLRGRPERIRTLFRVYASLLPGGNARPDRRVERRRPQG